MTAPAAEAMQQTWAADDARVLASIDGLTARIDHALTAPGSPWPIAEIGEVLRDTLALLRSEISR